MKTLLFFLLLPALCLAQERFYSLADLPFIIDSITGGLVFRDVVRVPDATADQLYHRAKSFLVRAFPNQSSIVQIGGYR